MDLLAYLSVLLIPLMLGIAILAYLTWQIVKDNRENREDPGDRGRGIARFVFAVVFWLAFVGFYIWRSLPE